MVAHLYSLFLVSLAFATTKLLFPLLHQTCSHQHHYWPQDAKSISSQSSTCLAAAFDTVDPLPSFKGFLHLTSILLSFHLTDHSFSVSQLIHPHPLPHSSHFLILEDLGFQTIDLISLPIVTPLKIAASLMVINAIEMLKTYPKIPDFQLPAGHFHLDTEQASQT